MNKNHKDLYEYAKNSNCNRAKVAAEVYDQSGTLLSRGYNKPISDSNICDEFNCTLEKPCNNTIHAEVDALEKAHNKGQPYKIVVTLQPCRYCARLLVERGIKEVEYIESYRDNISIEIFNKAGIKVWQM